MPDETYTTLKVTRPREYVVRVELNRPEKLNAMNIAFWGEIKRCFNKLSNDPDCRTIVLTGAGRIFTAGLDLGDISSISNIGDSSLDAARLAFKNRLFIKDWQESFTAIEKCHKPVIAAIHSACVGGGVDMTSACDIRYCTEDAWFQIKEIELGITADVGTLQRFPKIIGNDSQFRELAFTGRRFHAAEAKEMGFFSETGLFIIKFNGGHLEGFGLMGPATDRTGYTIYQDQDMQCDWNQGMVQTKDILNAIQAGLARKPAKFSKL